MQEPTNLKSLRQTKRASINYPYVQDVTIRCHILEHETLRDSQQHCTEKNI